jgi:hypothetical protein
MPADQPDPLNPSRKLYTYEGCAKPMEAPGARAVHLTDITAHIKRHVGPTQGAFHELVSDQVHLDVIFVPPTDKLPHWTLVTSGMSDRPMKPPSAQTKESYAELLIRLPREWVVPGKPGQQEWKKEEHYWPIRLLKFVARFPHKYGAFLWVGHTLDNGQPARPWSKSAPFKSAFLAPSRTLPKEFEDLRISDDKTIKFLALYPVYLEESQFSRQAGSQALWNKFVDHKVTDIIDPHRPNLVTGAAPTMKKDSWWSKLRGRQC